MWQAITEMQERINYLESKLARYEQGIEVEGKLYVSSIQLSLSNLHKVLSLTNGKYCKIKVIVLKEDV